QKEKKIDTQKLNEYSSAEGAQDLLFLLHKHGQDMEPKKRDMLIRKLAHSGVRLKMNEEKQLEGIYLSESAKKNGLDISSFEPLRSELGETQFLSFTKDVTVLEANHRERRILTKIIQTEEGQQALLKGELSPEVVKNIAEKMAVNDEEMKNDLQLLTAARNRIVQIEDEQMKNDIKKTKKSAPEVIEALESIFPEENNKVAMIKALHRNGFLLADCRAEGGRLHLNIEGVKLTSSEINITSNGFRVENEDFSFNLNAALKGVWGREETEKWDARNELDQAKREWFDDNSKFLKAAKLYKIAEEMPYMLPGFNKIRLIDRFSILISHIAAMPTEEFRKFADMINKIEDLKQIRGNERLKNMVQSMKLSEASPEAPVESLS
ncbi:MAG: hypothetical protein ABIG80_02460, partial [Patescibacteria group bacterium]